MYSAFLALIWRSNIRNWSDWNQPPCAKERTTNLGFIASWTPWFFFFFGWRSLFLNNWQQQHWIRYLGWRSLWLKKLWRCNKWQRQSLQQFFPGCMADVYFSAADEESCLLHQHGWQWELTMCGGATLYFWEVQYLLSSSNGWCSVIDTIFRGVDIDFFSGCGPASRCWHVAALIGTEEEGAC